ncbi:hypothetical protein ABIB00_002880 [Bradyrhizobium sp. LB14.3]|uniref:hypothetical protein n=1 Tax=Bradyrhizobium sp. LB14.3 TaxID=3156328 RepID=UPI0033937097
MIWDNPDQYLGTGHGFEFAEIAEAPPAWPSSICYRPAAIELKINDGYALDVRR